MNKSASTKLIVAIVIIIMLIAAAVILRCRKGEQGADGTGQIAFNYNGYDMVFEKTSKEIPLEYTLSEKSVTINECSLLISGEKYQLYTCDFDDETVYIHVDSDKVSKQNQCYWKFVSTDIYKGAERQ